MKRYFHILLLIFVSISSIVVTAQPPALFAVSGTSYCAGFPGVHFGVNNSITGDSYTLQKRVGTGPWNDVETISNAIGVTDYFTLFYTAATYRLKTTSPTIIITQTILPENLYNVTASATTGGTPTTNGAGDCPGSTTFPSIGLSGSQPALDGVIYKLYKDAA